MSSVTLNGGVPSPFPMNSSELRDRNKGRTNAGRNGHGR